MFGLDDWIARSSDGTTLLIVVAVSALLGLRHATDPDHLAAVTALITTGDDRSARTARRLGFVWGLGHATTLFAFGLPIVFFSAYLPEPVQRGAETAVGVMIVVLAVFLLLRWRRGRFHPHAHTHVHEHRDGGHGHGHSPGRRTPLGAYAIGLVHGMGGSAGVGLLLLAQIQSRVIAVAALAVLALFTAVSMWIVSAGWAFALGRPSVRRSLDRVTPALGLASMAFGVWYALGALTLVPYVF
jgi:ABC-type nickel/cobalt efflux system permease component RcnA